MGMETIYQANAARYDAMAYRRCGHSGLKLPAISLGLWHNFGETTPHATKREMCLTAFDAGITHFDLANNYGPPYGSAETAFGQIMAQDLAPYRDELIISTKAGYDMWPGPYGNFGSRKYLLASLDQSLARMGLDYVDIFYSHRFDPETPLEETMGALAHAVHSGKALYAGISSYNSQRTREAAELLADMGVPLLIHQPSYSMINRWLESDRLLATLADVGAGSICFSPLAQGMLTSKYLLEIPAESRVSDNSSLAQSFIKPETIERIKGLNGIAETRGQTLAQMALSWVLREQPDGQVTTALIGARNAGQVQDCVGAIRNLEFSPDELAQIDQFAGDAGINLWAQSSEFAGQSPD
jgi:L-glyceraldehyde 3-phosphate reductase